VLRARELSQVAGDNGEETAARDDVMYLFAEQVPKSRSVLV
jgi:hypothetical protein